MVVNKTISISEELDSLIDKFNQRNPFDKLNLSQTAQKAFYQKMAKIDPELISNEENKEQTKDVQKPIKKQKTFELVCIQCGKPFTAKTKQAKTCSDTCRSALSRKSKKQKSIDSMSADQA